MKEHILLGLKRASWLFALMCGIVGLIWGVVWGAYEYEWALIIGGPTVGGFLLFRLAIWVAKGFSKDVD